MRKLAWTPILFLSISVIAATTSRAETKPASKPGVKNGAQKVATLEEVERSQSELIQGTFTGLGQVKVRVDSLGEPVSQPLRVQVEISCGENRGYKTVLQDENACAYHSLSYDKAANALVLELGDYDPKKGQCSEKRTLKIALAQHCK